MIGGIYFFFPNGGAFPFDLLLEEAFGLGALRPTAAFGFERPGGLAGPAGPPPPPKGGGAVGWRGGRGGREGPNGGAGGPPTPANGLVFCGRGGGNMGTS